jgi:hypothetical protein
MARQAENILETIVIGYWFANQLNQSTTISTIITISTYQL